MINYYEAMEKLVRLGAIDTVHYINDNFVAPVAPLGFVPDKYEDQREENGGAHYITFTSDDKELPIGFYSAMESIMASGHDDGNDRPFWRLEYGHLTIVIPYSL